MSRPTISGVIDYRVLADAHRPTDEATLRVAVAELRQRGLTERDIGQALNLDPAAVRRLLGTNTTDPR